MGARRLLALIRGLPHTSKTAQELHPSAAWSSEAHLIAMLAERMDAGNRQLFALIAAANTPKGRTPPKPWPQLEVPRPGDVTVDEGLSIQSVRSAFASMN